MRIRNWREFQHYKDRNPPWIKVHRTLLDDPDWFGLPDSAARLLVELWLIASGTNEGEIPDDMRKLAFRLRRDSTSLAKDIKSLCDSNFLECASTMLADACTEGETEGEGETEKNASAYADEGEPSAEITFGEVMAVVRAELHLGLDDDECKRSGSVLFRDYRGKVAPADIIDACRGTRKLIESGLVDGVKPGERVGLRFLRTWKYDSRFLWDAALDRERLGPTPVGPQKKRGQTSLQRFTTQVGGA